MKQPEDNRTGELDLSSAACLTLRDILFLQHLVQVYMHEHISYWVRNPMCRSTGQTIEKCQKLIAKLDAKRGYW